VRRDEGQFGEKWDMCCARALDPAGFH